MMWLQTGGSGKPSKVRDMGIIPRLYNNDNGLDVSDG